MRVLSGREVAELVDVPALIPAMRLAALAMSRGAVELPLRSMVKLPGEDRMGIMAGWMGAPAGHGIKVLSLYPRNPDRGISSHAGLMILFDAETGLPRLVMNASDLTAIRTAAATALTTDILAPAGAASVALIGCGEQAAVHIAAMRAVRPIERFTVWGRDARKAAAFAEAHGIARADSVAEAIAAADIVVTATPARSPLVNAGMLRPGLHINAVGASVPTMQEFTADVLPRVRFVTDYIASMEPQAAEMIAARAQGVVGPDYPVIEIGAVIDGKAEGRRSADEITFYRSLGTGAQDLAAAHEILARAEAGGVGVLVDMA